MKKPTPKSTVIPCKRDEVMGNMVKQFAIDLRNAAPSIGSHKMTPEAFEASGLFDAAIEKLRGQRSASMATKKAFLADVLNYMTSQNAIQKWSFTGSGERHDYRVILNDGRVSIFEAKGCMDGNNTTIYRRPADADEFILWSLCQNPGSDPAHNAWSGIHTRLGAKIIADRELVDGLVIWDMLCGTTQRPCPKLQGDDAISTRIATNRVLPPPCIYMFPRSIPDPRNNPEPPTRKLVEVGLLSAIYDTFKCTSNDVTNVRIEARMKEADVQRRTHLERNGALLAHSSWTTLKQASR